MPIDPKDVGELQRALNDAAGKASVLWTTFITFELYLAIAFGSVTHRDLFLETPIKLPLLSVDLPLVGFFVVASTVLVIFHFYVFLHLLLLAAKAKDYDSLLRQQISDASDLQCLRQRLDSFLVLQLLVGPTERRTNFDGFSLKLIAWITLVGVPVLILLQGQVTFLPYHREGVVWLQRVAVLIDLAAIWYFWQRIRTDTESTVLSGLKDHSSGTFRRCFLLPFLDQAGAAQRLGERAAALLLAARGDRAAGRGTHTVIAWRGCAGTVGTRADLVV